MMVSSFTDAGSIKSFPAVVADHPTKKSRHRRIKQQRRYERLGCHKPVIPVVTFLTPLASNSRSKGSIGHAFTVRIRTENQNQTSFYPFVPHEISVLVELILGHLRYLLTDVPPQPNSPPDNVLRPDRPAEASLGSKRRGCYPASDSRNDEAFGYLKRVIVTPAVYPRLVEFLHFDIQSTGQKSHCVSIRKDHRNAFSELAVRRPGKLERAVPSPSPPTRRSARHVSGSSSPPTVDGFGTGTPEPSPQSQSFSRSYGSILPTSLAYIVPSTRGCSPWRPDAVMSTTGRERHSVLRIFKGAGMHRTPRGVRCSSSRWTLPRLSRFRVGRLLNRKDNSFRIPPTASPDSLTLPSTATSRFRNFNRIPFRSSRISAIRRSFAPIPKSDERFARQYRCGPPPEFPLAARSGIVHHLSGPDRHAHTRTLLRKSRSVGCAPVRDPANQLPYALRVYSPVDSHTCQTPWSVFQAGSNGSPQADARARRCRGTPWRVLQTTIKAAASPLA
ncbi:hypothetical protein Bca101_100903 [Brassica carinata]